MPSTAPRRSVSPVARRRVLTGMAAAAGVAAVGVALPGTAQAAVRPRTALAFLNHAYVVLDVATAEAISANAYLKEFGVYTERTTTNAEYTYTGRYLNGRETYLEIFPEGGLPGRDGELGVTGLAISPDRVGQIQQIRRRMVELGVAEPFDFTQTRQFDGEQVPWFTVVAPSIDNVAHFSWVMEYLESYMDDPRTGVGPASGPGDVSRDRYSNDEYRNRLMRDIVRVELDLATADLAAVTTTLRAGGYTVRERAGATVAVGRSDTVVLRGVDRSVAGWRRIGFVLNRAVPRHSEVIGRSRLEVAGRRASWSFERG